MTIWQGALAIVRHEIRRTWYGLLFSALFFVYVAAVMIPLFNDVADNGHNLNAIGTLGDFMYLTLLPNMGFMMSKGMMRYWRNDFFTRRLAYWRTLPISLSSIVISRVLQLLIVLTIVGAVFFTLQYLFYAEIRSVLDVGHYMLFVFTWVGYALAMSATYMYFEQTCRGKRYMAVCFAYIAFYAAIVVLFAWLGEHLVADTIRLARDGNAVPAVLMPLLGIAATAASGLAIRRKLAARSLLT